MKRLTLASETPAGCEAEIESHVGIRGVGLEYRHNNQEGVEQEHGVLPRRTQQRD